VDSHGVTEQPASRWFFQSQCGAHFKFDRSFITWLKAGPSKTMGDAVKEWQRRVRASPKAKT